MPYCVVSLLCCVYCTENKSKKKAYKQFILFCMQRFVFSYVFVYFSALSLKKNKIESLSLSYR